MDGAFAPAAAAAPGGERLLVKACARRRPRRWQCCELGADAGERVRLRADGQGPFGRGTALHVDDGAVTDNDGEPRLHVVFVHPRIHWNTGNMGRTCLGLGARLHLVGPLGFSLDEKQVRRAGLDYWHYVDLRVYESWEEFASQTLPQLGEKYYFTKYATQSILDVEFPQSGKMVLIFGSETNGLTDIEDALPPGELERHGVAFPMRSTQVFRSFNLSTSASLGLWEAYKQLVTR